MSGAIQSFAHVRPKDENDSDVRQQNPGIGPVPHAESQLALWAYLKSGVRQVQGDGNSLMNPPYALPSFGSCFGLNLWKVPPSGRGSSETHRYGGCPYLLQVNQPQPRAYWVSGFGIKGLIPTSVLQGLSRPLAGESYSLRSPFCCRWSFPTALPLFPSCNIWGYLSHNQNAGR